VKISQKIIDENLEQNSIDNKYSSVQNIMEQISAFVNPALVQPVEVSQSKVDLINSNIRLMRSNSNYHAVISQNINNNNQKEDIKQNDQYNQKISNISILENKDYIEEFITNFKEIITKNKMKMQGVVADILERSTTIINKLFKDFTKPGAIKEELSDTESSS